jgi:hypothetical protein
MTTIATYRFGRYACGCCMERSSKYTPAHLDPLLHATVLLLYVSKTILPSHPSVATVCSACLSTSARSIYLLACSDSAHLKGRDSAVDSWDFQMIISCTVLPGESVERTTAGKSDPGIEPLNFLNCTVCHLLHFNSSIYKNHVWQSRRSIERERTCAIFVPWNIS